MLIKSGIKKFTKNILTIQIIMVLSMMKKVEVCLLFIKGITLTNKMVLLEFRGENTRFMHQMYFSKMDIE